jgi:hypothetical protein
LTARCQVGRSTAISQRIAHGARMIRRTRSAVKAADA